MENKKVHLAVLRPSDGFPNIRAVGVKFPARYEIVISINLFDWKKNKHYSNRI